MGEREGEKRREACEKRSGRKAAKVTRMMDESSTPMHRRKKESVRCVCACVCVCVCVLREPPLIALAAHRHGGNIFWSATHSKRAPQSRMKRRGSMGCDKRKNGGGGYKRQRRETERRDGE